MTAQTEKNQTPTSEQAALDGTGAGAPTAGQSDWQINKGIYIPAIWYFAITFTLCVLTLVLN